LLLVHVLLLRLSYPPFHLGWLAWFAHVPLLCVINSLQKRWLILAFIIFQASFITWLAPIHFWGYLFLIIILAGFDLLAAVLARRAVFLFPVVFVAVEFFRVGFPYSLPFQVIGYTQYLYPSLLGPAVLGKIWLLSFCIYLVNYFIYRLLISKLWRYVLFVLAVLLFCFLISFWPRPATQGSLVIGLIQPARPMSVSDWRENREEFLTDYRSLTSEAVKQGAALVVWPETAIGVSLRHDRQLAKAIRQIIDQEKIELLVGNVDERLYSLRFKERYNSAFYIDRSGSVRGEHYKAKLIPFVETINYQLLLPWNIRNRMGSGEYRYGQKQEPMNISGQPVTTIICFEAQFPGYVSSLAKNSSLIINLSSDGWSKGSRTEHECNFMVNVLRAVENRQYLVRVADDGISALISPRGEILAQLPMGRRGVLVFEVPFLKTRIRTAPSVSVR
jgi:apolipoprotein N-acyltransferase